MPRANMQSIACGAPGLVTVMVLAAASAGMSFGLSDGSGRVKTNDKEPV